MCFEFTRRLISPKQSFDVLESLQVFLKIRIGNRRRVVIVLNSEEEPVVWRQFINVHSNYEVVTTAVAEMTSLAPLLLLSLTR